MGNNNGIILGLLGLVMYFIGLAASIFGIVSNASQYRLICASEGTVNESTTLDDKCNFDRPSSSDAGGIAQTISNLNPITYFFHNFVFNRSEGTNAIDRFLNGIGNLINLLFAGVAGYLLLATFQTSLPIMYNAVLTFPLNGYVIYTIWRLIRGGG